MELAHLNLELEKRPIADVVALYAELDEKAAALKRADEMKSHFLRYVGHEFRTPDELRAGPDSVAAPPPGRGPDAGAGKAGPVYPARRCRISPEMVNDLLDLAKVEAGKTEIRMTGVDLGPVLPERSGL